MGSNESFNFSDNSPKKSRNVRPTITNTQEFANLDRKSSSSEYEGMDDVLKDLQGSEEEEEEEDEDQYLEE